MDAAHDYLAVFDLGGLRYKRSFATEDEAREAIARMEPPDGYSRHEAILYEWRNRAVDNKPYLHTLDRWWFGERVDKEARA